MGDNRASAYWENHTPILRASSFGHECIASLARTLAGQPAAPWPESFQRKFAEGHEGEAVILKVLEEAYGWTFWNNRDKLAELGPVGKNGQVELELDLGFCKIRCHPDGIGVRVRAEKGEAEAFQVDKVAGFEVKALAESTFKKWEKDGLDVIPTYPWQVAIEMICLGRAMGVGVLPLVYAVGVKDADGKVIKDRVYPKYYTEPPRTFGQIIARARTIVDLARKLDEEGAEPECNSQAYPCGFYTMAETACGKAWQEGQAKKRGEDLRDYDGPDRSKLRTECANWLSADAAEKKAKAKKDAARGRIADLTGGTCRLGKFKITHEVADEGQVSWKAVAEDLGDEFTEEYLAGFRGKPRVTVKVETLEA